MGDEDAEDALYALLLVDLGVIALLTLITLVPHFCAFLGHWANDDDVIANKANKASTMAIIRVFMILHLL